MSTNDLERVKEDLATLKLALAPDLPFKPTTVRFAIALAVGGVLSLLWALHPYPLPSKWDIAIPMFLQVLPILITLLHFAISRKPDDCSVSAGEMKRAHLNYSPYVFALLAIPFLVLAMRAGWLPASFILPAFLFFFGAAVTAIAVTHPRQRFNLGLSVPMLVFAVTGLLLQWPHALLLGLTMFTGGAASAFIMRAQLRHRT
jgi:hypothetical protein